MLPLCRRRSDWRRDPNGVSSIDTGNAIDDRDAEACASHGMNLGSLVSASEAADRDGVGAAPDRNYGNSQSMAQCVGVGTKAIDKVAASHDNENPNAQARAVSLELIIKAFDW